MLSLIISNNGLTVKLTLGFEIFVCKGTESKIMKSENAKEQLKELESYHREDFSYVNH